jgi:hypothetical protein
MVQRRGLKGFSACVHEEQHASGSRSKRKETNGVELIRGLFGLTPHFASPHSSPPRYSKFSVADETSATCCGEMYRAVAAGGGEPNSP